MSGAVAQLGARLNGIQEVTGSTPVSSTNFAIFGPDDESEIGLREQIPGLAS